MRIGSRIVRPEELDDWDMELVQISLYRGQKHNIEVMKDCARSCRARGMPYVVHPVGYPLLETATLGQLKEMADWADEAMILHDERSAEGGRLSGSDRERFRENIDDLSSVTAISFENATNTNDVHWFWQSFAGSITLDIGHVEAAGLNSVEFVQNLDHHSLNKLQYVHVHRNGTFRSGLTDHWYLVPECRELKALEELLKRKRDIGVLLEINETDMIGKSLEILRELRERITNTD